MKKMKNLKRMVVAASLATMCLTAAVAQNESVEKIDLSEIGVDSATQSRLSDSTVVELTRMALEHKQRVQQEELRHEEQIMMMRHQSQNSTRGTAGMLFFVGSFSAIPILCIFIYKVMVSRSRRKREEATNEMLLKLVGNGQTLTPELVEAITKDSKQEKTAKELTMFSSLRKLFLGCGLIAFAIVFAIVFASRASGFEPISSIIAPIGIFYAAQGLAGYLTLRQEKETVQPSENL